MHLQLIVHYLVKNVYLIRFFLFVRIDKLEKDCRLTSFNK